jgi:2',3'-cyclic-nucleotide 2'-phosphodiesterase/3'-nucleotidase
VAELTLHKESTGSWKLQTCATRLLQPTPETVLDPEVLEVTGFLRAATDSYLNTYATDLKVDLDGRWCRMESTPLMRLLHDTLREATGAQVTAIQSPSSRLFIHQGPTSVRQFWALFPYEDRPARIRLNGAQLKRYLEYSARFFHCSHEPELFNRDIPPWDYDLVDGCTFALDLSKPVGHRIADLRLQGQPLTDNQTLTLGLTSGRAFGFGGHVEAIGYTEKPEFIHPQCFRNLLLERVLFRPSLELTPSNNWHTIPALDRERVLAQQP